MFLAPDQHQWLQEHAAAAEAGMPLALLLLQHVGAVMQHWDRLVQHPACTGSF
jgi:hypothetical protein